MPLPSGVELGWLSTLILLLERDSVGFGNSWTTIFWAVAASTPAAAASRSQFFSKARRWASASESRWSGALVDVAEAFAGCCACAATRTANHTTTQTPLRFHTDPIGHFISYSV